jgi:hypothetical protein
MNYASQGECVAPRAQSVEDVNRELHIIRDRAEHILTRLTNIRGYLGGAYPANASDSSKTAPSNGVVEAMRDQQSRIANTQISSIDVLDSIERLLGKEN